MGTEENPITTSLEVVLFGNRQSPTFPIYGNKVIAVRNSILEIHGAPRTFTWTVLD